MKKSKSSLLKFKKPFSWGFVVLFAVVIGVIVGVLDCIPALKDTSFTDPALTFDVWIPLAIFVVLGGKNTLDAAAKCFLFFLVSQPVIYLVEIACEMLFHSGTLAELFHQYFVNYYIGANWIWWTVLTLPGGAIAYQVKRDNVLSAVILSVATGALVGLGLYQAFNVLPNTFPRHLLSVIFCLGMAFALCFLVLKKKTPRTVALTITAVATVAVAAMLLFFSGKPVNSMQTYDLGSTAAVSCTVEDQAIATVELNDSNCLVVCTAEEIGETVAHVTFADGTTADYHISVDAHALNIEEK